MDTFVNLFLKTELTIIPSLLDKYIGHYYNNTLCNGATWMFVCWCVLHTLFDNLLNALLKRMNYKEYIRIRLQQSLWYLGFYSTACIYCSATLIRNNLDIVKLKMLFDRTNTISSQLILGFIVILTFYLHSAFWEKLKYRHGFVAAGYLCLFFLLCFSYFLRFVEGCFRLTILICLAHVGVEVARVVTTFIKRDTFSGKIITNISFTLGLAILTFNYVIIVPLLFGYPLVRGFTPAITFPMTFLLTWLPIELYSSALSKAIIHWLNHTPENMKYKNCDLDLIECSLFPPRDDATYNFIQMKKEMKEREERSLLLRKPNNKNIVYQTLKCMVAIKRKLNEKRKQVSNIHEQFVDEKENEDEKRKECNEISDANEEEIVGGKLEFNINSKNNEADSCKCKKD